MMKAMKRSCAVALAGGLASLVLGSTAAPAAAKPLERGHFQEISSEVVENFCGDLTVRIDVDVHGSFLFNFHGPDGLGYALESVHGSNSYTNLANGKP